MPGHVYAVRYLRSFFILVSAGILLLSGLNVFVDPYGLYGHGVLSADIEDKPLYWHQVLAVKPAQIRRIRPRSLIIGASRAMAGLDPEHPCWSHAPIFNLGLEGPSLFEVRRYFEHAVATSPVEDVVLTLDFYMFNQFFRRDTDFRDERLATSEKSWVANYPYLPDIFRGAVSIDSLKASILTLSSKREPVFNSSGLRIRPWHAPVRGDEASNVQLLFMRQLKRMAELTLFPAPEKAYRLSTLEVDRDGGPITELGAILRLAHERKISLHMVVSPVHAQMLETYRELGLWEAFENWKAELLRVNQQTANELGRMPFVIWDFSGYNPITTEHVPGAGVNDSTMQWYIDPSHFSLSTGQLILDRVLGCTSSPRLVQDFGVRLSSENLDDIHAQIRHAGASYRRDNRLLVDVSTWNTRPR